MNVNKKVTEIVDFGIDEELQQLKRFDKRAGWGSPTYWVGVSQPIPGRYRPQALVPSFARERGD